MICVVQRVCLAKVRVAGETVGEIGPGLLVLASVVVGDGDPQLDWTARKLTSLRVFPGPGGAYDRDVREVGGGLLVVSNFTVAADTRSGRRPGFSDAMPPGTARPVFDRLIERVRREHANVATGRFGADMQIELVNDGPLTLIVRSP